MSEYILTRYRDGRIMWRWNNFDITRLEYVYCEEIKSYLSMWTKILLKVDLSLTLSAPRNKKRNCGKN